mgnify:CR=1 FL=1
MRRRFIWVVEMFVNGGWGATVGIGLTRIDARKHMKSWQSRNPDDRFRLVRYIPQ